MSSPVAPAGGCSRVNVGLCSVLNISVKDAGRAGVGWGRQPAITTTIGIRAKRHLATRIGRATSMSSSAVMARISRSRTGGP